MYARGLSTRDIEDALIDSTGDQILSRTAVSRVTEILQEDFQAFQDRDLSSYQVEYLFLDAVYESIQERFGVSKAVLCAWAICRDGRKVLLHLEMGNHESFDDWREFLRDMIGRGLQMPTTHTTDGSKGLIKAVKACLPDSLRIRCWRHRMQNFQCKVAKVNWPEIKAELYVIREAADYERGKQLAADFIERYHKDYPSLIKAFKEDLEAFLAILKLPRTHRKNVRTTNLIERSFVEERRRTKIVPVFMTEKSLMKLVFATLIRAARRWQK